MTERMLRGVIAGVELRHVVGLDIHDEPKGDFAIPRPGITHATISISPRIPLVSTVIEKAISVFGEEVRLELDNRPSEVTLLHASIENDKSQAMRWAYLKILGNRVLLAANGGERFLEKHELPLEPRLLLEPPPIDQ